MTRYITYKLPAKEKAESSRLFNHLLRNIAAKDTEKGHSLYFLVLNIVSPDMGYGSYHTDLNSGYGSQISRDSYRRGKSTANACDESNSSGIGILPSYQIINVLYKRIVLALVFLC